MKSLVFIFFCSLYWQSNDQSMGMPSPCAFCITGESIGKCHLGWAVHPGDRDTMHVVNELYMPSRWKQ